MAPGRSLQPLEQRLLRTRQCHKAVAQRLENRIGDERQLLDEIVLIVNAGMRGHEGLGTAWRQHVLNPATTLVPARCDVTSVRAARQPDRRFVAASFAASGPILGGWSSVR